LRLIRVPLDMPRKSGSRFSEKDMRPQENAAMKSPMDQTLLNVETIGEVIARSPIIVSPPMTPLPECFDEVDLAVLDWLAAEGARLRRGVALVH
jgi:hypothetical protein